MKKYSVPIAAIALALSGCGPTPYDFAVLTPPSAWSSEEMSLAASLPTPRLCYIYANGRSLPNINNRVVPAPYSRSDYASLTPLLKQRGMTTRDLEILSNPLTDFGTGQSYKGLLCSLGSVQGVNKSFIAGQHRWQVVTNTRQYIYLEGNGTEEGMRVTGWN